MTRAHWPAIAEIYREGIASGDATFETEVPEWTTWAARLHPECRIVARMGDRVVGFACVTPTSTRAVYEGVAEVMLYVAEDWRGEGVGGRLLAALVEATERAGIWTLQASIFPENVASVKAHERAGFRTVGTRVRVGRFHDGRWRDTVLLERRSESVGLD